MKEIIFRAKSRIGNNWKYGYLTKTCENSGDKYWIDVSNKDRNDSYEIDPDTVGQYIGRTDKNGEKIYDGDIVKSFQIYPNGKRYEVIREVKWINDRLFPFADDDLEYGNWWEELTKNCEVIGNIYDNPELLGE